MRITLEYIKTKQVNDDYEKHMPLRRLTLHDLNFVLDEFGCVPADRFIFEETPDCEHYYVIGFRTSTRVYETSRASEHTQYGPWELLKDIAYDNITEVYWAKGEPSNPL